MEVDEDGLRFHAETVEAERISEDADYEGVRVTFVAHLERAKIPIQIDIGFGDIVTPAPSETDYPTLLEFLGPRLLAYPKKTVVAEKLEALVKLGIANTRMKDFYDLEVLSRTFAFKGKILAQGSPADLGVETVINALRSRSSQDSERCELPDLVSCSLLPSVGALRRATFRKMH